MNQLMPQFFASQYVKYHPVLTESLEFRQMYVAALQYFLRRFGENQRASQEVLSLYRQALIPEDAPNQSIRDMDAAEMRSVMTEIRNVRFHPFQYFRFFPDETERPEPCRSWGGVSYRYAFYLDCLYLCAYQDETRGHLLLLALDDFFRGEHRRYLDLFRETVYQDAPLPGGRLFGRDYGSVLAAKGMAEALRFNRSFFSIPPISVMVVATMSAGKSTLINALVGRRLCKTQNMACTGRLCYISGKPFDDDQISRYDGTLSWDAGEGELPEDGPRDLDAPAYISAYYRGALRGKRLTLIDTPGINASEHERHRDITQEAIRRGAADVLLYVFNATQLRTTDDDVFLRFVAENWGKKPVLFVMNKADALLTEEEDACGVLDRQMDYLRERGFSYPILCPVSAKTAWLYRKGENAAAPLSRMERRELEALEDKFERCDLSDWYRRNFRPFWPKPEEGNARLLQNCGMAQLEDQLCHQIEIGGLQ